MSEIYNKRPRADWIVGDLAIVVEIKPDGIYYNTIQITKITDNQIFGKTGTFAEEKAYSKDRLFDNIDEAETAVQTQNWRNSL